MGTAKPRKPIQHKPVKVSALRWTCDAGKLSFDSTAEVKPALGLVGQDSALEALRFGLETRAPGQNIFVRGLTGTGRISLVRRRLEEISLAGPMLRDCCFVHNFQQPDRPQAIRLLPGQGREFRRAIQKLAAFIRHDLSAALTSEGTTARKESLEKTAKERVDRIIKPFEAELTKSGFQLVSFQSGPVTQTACFPVVNGKPTPPEEFVKLHTEDAITDEQFETFKEKSETFGNRLSQIDQEVGEIRTDHIQAVAALMERSTRWILGELIRKIEEDFPHEAVRDYLADLMDDVVNSLDRSEEEGDCTRLYRVNLLVDRKNNSACPIVAERTPTLRNLLGTIDYEFGPGDQIQANHMGIRAGALLQADGGFLILDARDLLNEPGAWRVLVRTLRHGQLEIIPPDPNPQRQGPSLKPEAIDIEVKVVLIGDTETYYALDRADPDFSQLFKVLADIDTVIPRNRSSVKRYAQVLARLAQEEQLPPFDRTAVAALAEQGARIAGKGGKLTARFGRLADVAREAAYLAVKRDKARVEGVDVMGAVARGKERANLPSQRFREFVKDGTIRVETRGSAVGQINGMAVLQAGPLTYGFPARITATIGPGTAGVINIEREAALSGAIHTKGFYILGGLLRFLLRTDHPLAFDASVAFEQSYGGIDGDSASGAEVCCLISALTDLPLRQDFAMTGAIDQVGNVLAIGAVNEKIEGFYDACLDRGINGNQGVVIPRANARDLMLRQDVVAACEKGRFRVHAVDTIHQALEILLNLPAGKRKRNGLYPEDTVLGMAVDRARNYWQMAAQVPPVKNNGL